MQSFYILNIQYDPYLSNIINNIFVVKQVRFYLFFHALPKWNFNSFNFRIVSRIWLGLSDTFCTVFPSGQFFDIICRCPFIPISLKFGISKMIMELLSNNLLRNHLQCKTSVTYIFPNATSHSNSNPVLFDRDVQQ